MAQRRLLVAAVLAAGSFPLTSALPLSASAGAFAPLVGLVFLWLPVAAITAEVASTIPALGGPYAWGRVAFGSGWGFAWAWWRTLVAILDVALVGGACAWLYATADIDIGVASPAVAPLSVAIIGVAVAAFPSLMWGMALTGSVAILASIAISPAVATLALEAPASIAMVTVGMFGGVFVMHGADLAWLLAREATGARRTIVRGTIYALGVVSVGVLGRPVLAAAWGWSGFDDSISDVGLDAYLVALFGCLLARGAIGIGVGARLVGALAGDRYLPDVLALGEGGRPSRQSLAAIAGLAVVATFVVEADTVAALATSWAASIVMLAGSLVVIRVRHDRLLRGFTIPGGVQMLALTAAVAIAGVSGVVVETAISGGVRWALVAGMCLVSGPIAWVALTIAVKRGRSNMPVPIAVATRWFDSSQPGAPELAGPVETDVEFGVRVSRLLPTPPGAFHGR